MCAEADTVRCGVSAPSSYRFWGARSPHLPTLDIDHRNCFDRHLVSNT